MTREEAEAACARHASEHPDRATHTWMVREASPEEWSVVKVRVPGGIRHPLKTTTEAVPEPAQPEDPRSPMDRNIGPYGAGF